MPENPKDIRSLVESDKFKQAVAAALPAHLTPNRFVRIALTALTRTPKLNECDQQSLLSCMMQLSQFGLEPDGRHAHLIPFWNSKRNTFECQLIIDYKGLANLAMRSGTVSYVHADKVCENDVFEYNKGQVTKHVIDFTKDRGKPYAYYAMVRFKDGDEKADAMTMDDVKAIRARSRAKDSGPWVTDFDEMGKKTVFRRLSKWLPLSAEYRDAVDMDVDALEELRFDNAKPVIARAKIAKLKDKDLPVPASAEPLHSRNEVGQSAAVEAREDAESEQREAGTRRSSDTSDSRGGQDSKKKAGAKLRKKEKSFHSETPNREAMTALLKEIDRSVDEFVLVAIEQDWITRDKTWDTLTENDLSKFVHDQDNRELVLSELKALKK